MKVSVKVSKAAGQAIVRLWKLEGSRTSRYLLPIVAILFALLIQAAIMPFLPKNNDFPFALFYLVGLLAAAWWGGYGPGAIACVLIMVGLPLAAVPHFRLAQVDRSRLLLLLGVSLGVSGVAHAHRRGREALRLLNQELDHRVQMRTRDLAQAVEDLQESEQRVDFALDAAGIGRWDLDLATRKADRSLRHDQIFGHETLLPEWTYDSMFEQIVEDDRPKVAQQFKAALAGKDVCEFECRIRLAGGEIRWIWGRGKVRRDDFGKPVSILGSIGDITDRKLADSKLHTQLQRMHLLDQITRAVAERQDLRSVFQVVIGSLEDNLPIDFGCACLYNREAETLTVTSIGVGSEQLAGELGLGEQSSIVIDRNGLSRCVRGQLVYEPDVRLLDFPFPSRIARVGLRSLVAAPLLVESQVFGVLVVARRQKESFTSGDCEFLRQLSEHVALAVHQAQVYSALEKAYEDLRRTQQTVMRDERLRALGQMASGIAHDINNAISPVALYTELLLESEPSLSLRTRKYLETTLCAIEDVAQTVARMREFYRQPQDQIVLEPVNLNRMAAQIADLTRARWSDMPLQRGIVIQLEMDLAPDLPQIGGIENEIREALTNLVFNAVDAMPEGGAITLRTRASESPDGRPQYVYVEVADTGIGMDPETRRRCLEPFFTTKGQRGTGLGLAMVYGVAQRHGAEIELESAQGVGTTVRLRFPLPSEPQREPATFLPGRQTAGILRLLLVDDDPLLIKSVRDILEEDGHTVTTVNKGQDAIDLFQASVEKHDPFQVVITDLGMPYVDGRTVARAVKMASPSTPVILLTGWGQRLVAEGKVPPHVDRVLNKPPRLQELRATLAEVTATQRVSTLAS
jgi:signal transduction histidine kinase/ActR/RegA family two-component response regulator